MRKLSIQYHKDWCGVCSNSICQCTKCLTIGYPMHSCICGMCFTKIKQLTKPFCFKIL